VVGAGRWGRVHTRSLVEDLKLDVVLVARSNADSTRAWAKEAGLCPAVQVVQVVPDRPALEGMSHAIVARAACDHYACAAELLSAGLSVLVEKPIVPTPREYDELQRIAGRVGKEIYGGLELFYLTPLRKLAAEIRHSKPSEVSVLWWDQAGKQRWGAEKRIDYSADVTSDYFPHVWVQLRILLGEGVIRDVRCVEYASSDRGRFEFFYDDVKVRLALDRASPQQRRELTLGERVWDFSSSGNEAGTLSPVSALLRDFLQGAESPNSGAPLRQLVADTAALLDSRPAPALNSSVELWRSRVAGAFKSQGLVGWTTQGAQLDAWAARAQRVVRRASQDPFLPHEALAAAEGLDAESFQRLCAAIRKVPEFQHAAFSSGAGAKYWSNLILPFARSGLLGDVIEKRARYPHRVGIYAGSSCSFECSFCGRVRGEEYRPPALDEGSERLQRLIDEAPNSDPARFYFSGGLEPLTNSRLGPLATRARGRGFRPNLYTNGFMLTPRHLEKHSGLWDFEAIRISLYGFDEASYAKTANRAGAFARVRQNVVDVLRIRAQQQRSTRLGANFVVQRGRIHEVTRVLDFLEATFRESGASLDFLTLREDYSLAAGAGLSVAERESLARFFERAQERVESGALGGLQLDLGFGLHALSQGIFDLPLCHVESHELRPHGHPQASVVVDLHGDVFLYREAGFLRRPGNERYVIGNLRDDAGLEQMVRQFLAGPGVVPRAGDERFLDAFDHAFTRFCSKLEADLRFGVPFQHGPVSAEGDFAFTAWNP
jgi:dTDP-4-amino-4,6-dideoxy-D-glucose ammonia-lyase